MSYFNETYYLNQYADVRSAVSQGFFTSGLQHFRLFGSGEGRSPSAEFNVGYYGATNPDVQPVVNQGVFSTSLQHFDMYGVGESRAPSSAYAGFNSTRYLAENADVQAAVTAGNFKSGLDHYLLFGAMESRAGYSTAGVDLAAKASSGSVSYFNEIYYLDHNPDVQAAVALGQFASGLQHFQLIGASELRNPSANFDAGYYIRSNPDVQAAINQGFFTSALQHFTLYGAAENRAPTAALVGFDAARYLTDNPDAQAAVAAGSFRSALDHYLQIGTTESRPAYTISGTTILGSSNTTPLTSGASSVDEGGSVAFTLQTTNVAVGAQVAYTISGVSAADVQGGSLTGTVTIGADGRAIIPVTLVSDAAIEGAEILTVTIGGQSASVTVNDTSSLQTFTLSSGAAAGAVSEGSTLNFTLQTTNVAAGAQYTYTIAGVSSADVQGGSLTGTVTIGADGRAIIPVTLVNDATTEGTETMTVTVAGQTATVAVVDTSGPVQTFSLTSGATSVNEGGSVTFTLRTTNVTPNSQYAYTITGVSAADVVGGSLTGTVTIGADGRAIIPVALVNDVRTEGAEGLAVTVAGRTHSVTVNDTSTGASQIGSDFALTLAVDNFAGGANADTFTGTYSDGAGDSFNGDTLAGGGDTDTLNLTIGAEAIILADNVWTNVSGIETVVFNTSGGSGAQTINTGAAFNSAFTAGGVNLTSQTLLGAITIDMSAVPYTGVAAITTTTIGAGAHTVTAGSGATTVAATSTVAGSQTIAGVGLTTVTATINGAGNQVIGGGSSASLVTVTASVVGTGDQTITSSSTSAVTVTATAAAGSQTITTGSGADTVTSTAAAGQVTTISTGAGNDTIVAGLSTDLITGGLGVDTMTGGGGVDTFAFSTNGSVIGTSRDIITDINTGGTDVLTFGGNTSVLAADGSATVAGANVQTTAGGLITFAAGDNTLALKIVAVQADAELDAAGSVGMFVDGANTYVYYAGAATGDADDQLIQLTGITSLVTITGGTTTTFA